MQKIVVDPTMHSLHTPRKLNGMNHLSLLLAEADVNDLRRDARDRVGRPTEAIAPDCRDRTTRAGYSSYERRPTPHLADKRPTKETTVTDLEITTAVGSNVLFENKRIRVWEMVLAPGETCEPHRHVQDHLVLYAEPARIRTEVSGRPVIQHVEDGLVSYRSVGREGLAPHSITNAAHAPSRHFIIELLGPSASDAPSEHQHNGRGQTEVVG